MHGSNHKRRMFLKSEAAHVAKIILKYFTEILGRVNLFNLNKGWIITSYEYEAKKALDPMAKQYLAQTTYVCHTSDKVTYHHKNTIRVST